MLLIPRSCTKPGGYVELAEAGVRIQLCRSEISFPDNLTSVRGHERRRNHVPR
jgi:hypothetical protein